MTAEGDVVVRQDGNGGVIFYTEPGIELQFSWEFAMPPSIALVFRPLDWMNLSSAPIERKIAVFRRVAEEVIRQRAPGGTYDLDINQGIADIRCAR